jgi:hypothetical protein
MQAPVALWTPVCPGAKGSAWIGRDEDAAGRIIGRRMSVDASWDEQTVADLVDRLVEEHRVTCLWFLRPDFRPSTREERIAVLEQIERHGDREAYRRAATLKRWLSRTSSAASAGS